MPNAETEHREAAELLLTPRDKPTAQAPVLKPVPSSSALPGHFIRNNFQLLVMTPANQTAASQCIPACGCGEDDLLGFKLRIRIQYYCHCRLLSAKISLKQPRRREGILVTVNVVT